MEEKDIIDLLNENIDYYDPVHVEPDDARKIKIRDIPQNARIQIGMMKDGICHIELEGEIVKTEKNDICIFMAHNWYRKWWSLPLGMPQHMDLMKRLLEFREKEFADIEGIEFEDQGDWCNLYYTIKVDIKRDNSLYDAYQQGVEAINWINKIVDSAQDKVSELIHKIAQEYSGFKLVEIPELINKLTNEQDSNEKGRILEELVSRFFSKVDGFKTIERLRTETEEIDIVIINESGNVFWKKESPLILIECKNWTSKCGKNELVIFKEKLINRKGRAKIGFFVSWNGFSSTFLKEDLRSSHGDVLIIPVTGDDILSAIQNQDDIETEIKKWWISATKI